MKKLLSHYRDDNNTLLSYKAYELTYDLVIKSFQEIENYDSIKKISEKFELKFIRFYFDKIFFKEFMHFSDEFVLFKKIEHDKVFSPNYSSYIPHELIKKIFKKNPEYSDIDLNFNKKKNKEFKQNLKIIIKNFLSNLFSKKQEFYKSDYNIAIKYDEGLDLNKRNDIYWIEHTTIPYKNIIIYIEHENQYKKFLFEYKNSIFYNKGIKIVKLWKCKYRFSKRKKFLINFNKPQDKIEKWVIQILFKVINEINFWYNFFEEFNIKFHTDPNEYEENPIFKHIAIDKLNGLTFGRLRSYPNLCRGYFHYYYMNDIFFVWGDDSNQRLRNHKNLISYYINSGYTYGGPSIEKLKELDLIRNKFTQNNIKYTILVVDSNIANNFYEQGITKEDYIKFYLQILKLLDNKNIGLIIKSKDPLNFFLKQKISDLFLNNNNCYVVKERQLKSSDYATISNYVIGIQPQISSAFWESFLVCKNGIFFDYANLNKYEKEIYSLKNKLYINSFFEFNEIIDNIIKDPKILINKNIEEVNSLLDKIDRYNDFLGPKRISKFISKLFQNYDLNLNKFDIIEDIMKNYIYNSTDK